MRMKTGVSKCKTLLLRNQRMTHTEKCASLDTIERTRFAVTSHAIRVQSGERTRVNVSESACNMPVSGMQMSFARSAALCFDLDHAFRLVHRIDRIVTLSNVNAYNCTLEKSYFKYHAANVYVAKCSSSLRLASKASRCIEYTYDFPREIML